MSMPVEGGIDIAPMDVRVVGGNPSKDLAADFGSWKTFNIAANANQLAAAQQILPIDRNRSKARINVFAGTGAAATAFVLLGSRTQIQNGQGGTYLAGGSVTVENSQEVWLTGDGVNAMIVSVLAERYAVE